MKRCRCIKESSWFLIDDSFDKGSKINGGKSYFEVGSEYDFFEVDSWSGKGMSVIHPKHGKENPTVFD